VSYTVRGSELNKVKTCISDAKLNDYLSSELSKDEKKAVEGHLKECNTCLDKMVFAYKTVSEFNKSGEKGVIKMETLWKKNLWLIGTIIAFTLSFIVPRYFLQLLVAAILMGTKWIFDSVNARILIMIYDAWNKGGKDEASKVLQGLNDRIKL